MGVAVFYHVIVSHGDGPRAEGMVTMGVYIYRLEPKTRQHPAFGEVGVLKYWDRLEWADSEAVEKQERAIARHNEKWAGRLPKYVVIRWRSGVGEQVYDFSKNGEAVWYDTESLPEAVPMTA